MDPIEYYTTTILTDFKTMAPLLAFLVGGYLIFIKGPFFLLRKSIKEQKTKLENEDANQDKKDKYSVEDYLEFQRKLKLMNAQGPQEKGENVLGSSQKNKESQKADQKKTQQHESQDKKSDQKKGQPKKPHTSATGSQTPEDIFSFKSDEKFTQLELKKRYFQLLKENHPDRVASMGPDFKKLAEKNT
jgi:hypothetical protein